MKPTLEQQEIVVTAQSGTNLAISAFAGAAKTTTCKLVAESLPKKSLYIAFNKAIADEAKTKFPNHVECRTLHSIAYETIVKGNKPLACRLKPNFDSREFLKLIQPWTPELSYTSQIKYVRKIRKAITEFCQSAEKDIVEIAFNTMRKSLIAELSLKIGYENIDWDFVDDEATKFKEITTRVWDILIHPNSDLSINHDVYLKMYHLANPTIHNAFKVIYLDEAQDSNDLTLDIVLKCAEKGCQVILVGDTFQSIYAWRGAVNAFDKIPNNFVKKSLTTSFRFHKGVADVANKIIGYMGAQETLIGAGQIKNPDPVDKAILCRTNKGVITQVLAANSRGEKVYCTSEFSTFFNMVYHGLALLGGYEVKFPYVGFADYENKEQFIKAAQELDDDAAQVLNFIDSANREGIKVTELINKAKASISKTKEEGMVTITTMHKSKGLEWDIVEIIDDCISIKKDEDVEVALKRIKDTFVDSQLGNLLYVAVTRAKQQLTIAPLVKELIYL